MGYEKSTRIKRDKIEEKVLAKRLDYIYPQIGLNIKRTNDIENQVKGSDFVFPFRDRTIVVDEKNATTQYDKNLQTFAIELMFNDKNSVTRPGWFIKKDSITDIYALGYIRAPKGHNYFKDKLTSIEILFVGKRKIAQYLSSVGYKNPNQLITMFKDAQEQQKTKVHDEIESLYDIDENFHLSYSFKYQEHPLNMVFKKDFLKSIACLHFIAKYPDDNPNAVPEIKIYRNDLKRPC